MSQETRLARKLRQLGISQDHHVANTVKKRFEFRLYFPRPPYGPVEYTAAKQGDGLNFVGQLLGHGGCTLKRIQIESGTRVEVHDGKGNLNGTHPSYTDPSLHAVVYAESREKLNKAVRMIADVLQPLDAAFERFDVTPGGTALLKPAIPKKAKSPRSETSSQSQGAAWGGTSTPSSENGSFVSPVTDIDSAYVHDHHPWRSVPTFQGRDKGKIAQNKSENALSGMRPWDTWGFNCSDSYNQFTTLTQTVVSEYAKQSRQMKQPWEHHYYDNADSGWTPWIQTGLNGANAKRSVSHFAPTHGTEFRSWGKESKCDPLDGFPLPHVYEDLIGTNESENTLEASRLTSAYHIPLESEMRTHKSIHQRIALPHDL